VGFVLLKSVERAFDRVWKRNADVVDCLSGWWVAGDVSLVDADGVGEADGVDRFEVGAQVVGDVRKRDRLLFEELHTPLAE
jgi:hypothetical protein